jgi:uncharacterized protein
MKSQYPHESEKNLYPVEFHPVKENGAILVYDVEEVRLIKLNDLEFEIVEELNETPLTLKQLKKRIPNREEDAVETAVNEMKEIKLIAETPFKMVSKEEISASETGKLDQYDQRNPMHIALNVTHKCNLDCDYCYGDGGTYGGPPAHMTRETAKQAVDFLFDISGEKEKSCRITLFGGEPLLHFELVKFVIDYARKKAAQYDKNIYFGITTNGTLLDDENSDYLLNEKVDVTFSLDGPRQIHDSNRKFKQNKNKSSFDLTHPNVLRFIEKAARLKNPFYALRATLTRPALQNYLELRDFFNGFDTKNVSFDYAEYKHASPGNLSIDDSTLEAFGKSLKRISNEVRTNLESDYISVFSRALSSLHFKKKKKTYCASPGYLYLGISSEGEIFPCHRFVGHKDTKLGNVWDGFDRPEWLKKLVKANIYSSNVCSNCWARYACGGLCLATGYYFCKKLYLTDEAEIEPVHCKIFKMIYEEALLLYAYLSENAKTDTEKFQSVLQEEYVPSHIMS